MTKAIDITMRNRQISIAELYTHLMDYEIVGLEQHLDVNEMSFYIDCILARVELPTIYGFAYSGKSNYIYSLLPNKYLLSIIHYMHGDFVYTSSLEYIKSVSFTEQDLSIKRRIRETYVNIAYFDSTKNIEEFSNKFINAYKTQNLL